MKIDRLPDADTLSARELLNKAKQEFDVPSMYALAGILRLPPGYLQRYNRKNSMPLAVRRLIQQAIDNG